MLLSAAGCATRRHPARPCGCAGTSARAASRTWRRRRWRQGRRPAAEAACSPCRHPDRRSVTPGQHPSQVSRSRASPKTSVCRSTSSVGGRRAHQRHVVERRDEDAAVGQVDVQEVLELAVAGGGRLAARARRRARRSGTRRGRRAGRPTTARPWASMACLDAVGEAGGERGHAVERLVGEDVLERGAGGGQRERVAGQRAADAAGVDRGRRRGRRRSARRARRRSRRRRTGTPPAIALPIVTMSGLEAPRARGAARAGAEGVRLVVDEQRAVLAREARGRPRGSPARAARCRCWSAPAPSARRRRRRGRARARAARRR